MLDIEKIINVEGTSLETSHKNIAPIVRDHKCLFLTRPTPKNTLYFGASEENWSHFDEVRLKTQAGVPSN